MTETERATAETDATEALRPLPGVMNLVGEVSAGLCSGGVCHLPTPPAEKAE